MPRPSSSMVARLDVTRLMVVLGTRPEAIKLAPLVLAARTRQNFDVVLCNTGQHRELTRQVLRLFRLVPDVDLDLMRHEQTPTDVTVRVLTHLNERIKAIRPDWVVVQGDTTTTFAAALAAFYQAIPVAHVEAGLRTDNIYSPWPEEMNRKLVSAIASLHFAPTDSAAANLRREGVSEERLTVTGNTGIDALKSVAARLFTDPTLRAEARTTESSMGLPIADADQARPYVLITGHRRESFGPGIAAISHAIAELGARYPGHDFIYAVHPNPRVRDTVHAVLGRGRQQNIYLVPPLEYLLFVDLIARADLILTDSGGVQEEAASLGVRVVVLRDVTERTEGLAVDLIRLAGTVSTKIIEAADEAFSGRWPRPAGGCDLYGDGLASDRILDRIACATHDTCRSNQR